MRVHHGVRGWGELCGVLWTLRRICTLGATQNAYNTPGLHGWRCSWLQKCVYDKLPLQTIQSHRGRGVGIGQQCLNPPVDAAPLRPGRVNAFTRRSFDCRMLLKACKHFLGPVRREDDSGEHGAAAAAAAICRGARPRGRFHLNFANMCLCACTCGAAFICCTGMRFHSVLFCACVHGLYVGHYRDTLRCACTHACTVHALHTHRHACAACVSFICTCC